MSIRHSATNEPPVHHNPAEAHGTLSFVFCHPVVTSLSVSVMDVSLISRCCVCGSCLCLLPVWGLSPLSSNSSLPPFSVFESSAVTSSPFFLSLLPLLAQDLSGELPQKHYWWGNWERRGAATATQDEWSLWAFCCQNWLKTSDYRDMFWIMVQSSITTVILGFNSINGINRCSPFLHYSCFQFTVVTWPKTLSQQSTWYGL